jgi:signal transduction histidine kinase
VRRAPGLADADERARARIGVRGTALRGHGPADAGGEPSVKAPFGLPLRAPLYGLVALALIGCAGLLAWNTRPADERSRVAINATLQTLRELDARMDLAVLGARLDPAAALRAESTVLAGLESSLGSLAEEGRRIDSMALAEALPEVSAAFADKLARARRIIREADLLGGSLREALAELEASTAEPARRRGEPPPAPPGPRAAAELLAWWAPGGDARAPSLATTLAALPTSAAGAREAVGRLAERRAPLDRDIERYSLATAGPRLAALTAAFSSESLEQVERSQLFRTYLLFYASALLVLLGWIAMRLLSSWRLIGRMNVQLRESNENLEQKVALRTRELSDALDHLKASEAQLVQSEKMSSLGVMVAGIAHEINTPVAYVKSSLGSIDSQLRALRKVSLEAERLLALLDRGDASDAALDTQLGALSGALGEAGGSGSLTELRTLLRDGQHGIEQIGRIIGHLRDFSRLDRGEVASFDLHEAIESTLLLARPNLRGIDIDRRFFADATLVASASKINQVLLNLITNAAQAMAPGGGTLTLSTRDDGAHIVLEVIDSGCGIAPDVLPRIFDPFFTTKPVGEGTGLGLSISYKIVAEHGGRIEVESVQGKGSTFRVRLPRSRAGPRPQAAGGATLPPAPATATGRTPATAGSPA